MDVGEREAADMTARLMLDTGTTAIHLTGSAARNGAALLLALLRSHKRVYGKRGCPGCFVKRGICGSST